MTGGGQKIHFAFLFSVYLVAAASETFISPLFPLVRDDLGLAVSDQAAIIAVLTLAIGVGNLLGGWLGTRYSDRRAIRLAAAALAVGCALSGASQNMGMLTIGQAVAGLGGGLFFGPGLAVVGRLYVTSRGRAIATYGLAYSLGLAAAAFSSSAGADLWRAVFFVTAAMSAGLAIATPKLAEADGPRTTTFIRDAVSYWADPPYLLALMTGVAAGVTHYVVIGLTPQHFVERGAALTLAAGLIGAGRLASVGGKVFSGWLFDRIGGPRTAQILLAAIVAFGAIQMLLPRQLGLLAIAPLVCVTAMLFPVSNAMVVVALPARASWGVGVYRSTLMLASAVSAGVVSLALLQLDTGPVMLIALAVPLAVGLWIGHSSGARQLMVSKSSSTPITEPQ